MLHYGVLPLLLLPSLVILEIVLTECPVNVKERRRLILQAILLLI